MSRGTIHKTLDNLHAVIEFDTAVQSLMCIPQDLRMVIENLIDKIQHAIDPTLQLLVVGMLRNELRHFEVLNGIGIHAIPGHSDSTTVIIGATTVPIVTMLVVIGDAGGYE